MKSSNDNKNVQSKVLDVRPLTESAAVIRFERHGLAFIAGQYLSVGVEGFAENREYSVYSSPNDDALEILVKEVEDGILSPRLCAVSVGDVLRVSGPRGHFMIKEEDLGRQFLFIATGTGIAPFRSLTETYPGLDYRLFHGVRHMNERYEHERYGDRYVGCLTRDAGGDYHGRVTSYLDEQEVAADTLCYLCGNCDMIYDAFAILVAKGVNPDNLHAEVYF